ncbi:MAG: hypothetical protein CVU30_13920 [Betaproteobacteria bacterium HGW-Betaproteobacteria-3]|jgi:phage gpG-like protein|nr:MAG: hypothetical protein CVU30_13920 [Betaproteobacteria bacterium HGW-Betaproteobacteria-3]
MRKNLIVKTAVALALAAPLLASAESQFVVGTGSASAKLDFRVVIPRVLFLGVGTGAAVLSTTGTVDVLTFDYTSNPNAIGTNAAAGSITNTGTNPTGSTFPVRVFGNDGQITLTAVGVDLISTTTATDIIPITQITGTSSASASLPLPAPGASVTLPAGRVTNETANWTFSYANAAVVPAGTYNGRVTYTASMP